MELQGSTVLLLGGGGLVGRAVARRLLDFHPARIILVSLHEREVREAAAVLRPAAGTTDIVTEWGNVFFPTAVAQLDRQAVLENAANRALVIQDILDELSPEVLNRSFLFDLFKRHQPQAVVDGINTATAFAYQDVFQSARMLLDAARSGPVSREQAERHVLTLTMPQLIRHVQIINEALRACRAQAYVKIGTSGTGGMGLNVPYTHSEERPSRQLLTKSAVAGAHSLLLFLVGRTPGAPATVEVKPTATIGWREIAYGPIRRSEQPLTRFDCPEPLSLDRAFRPDATGWNDTGAPIESVYIDVGENGYFAREEFETITAMGSMELITAEEVAEYVIMELEGRPTGRDIVAALDAATAGPTYRAGILRAAAIERLKKLEALHNVHPAGFEMLGPPRVTKLLYEAQILGRLRPSVKDLSEADPAGLSKEAASLLAGDRDLRSLIVSVGLPILLPGRRVYRAGRVMVPPDGGDPERSAPRGWVDLREENCRIWTSRARRMVEQAGQRNAGPPASGSDVDWGSLEPGDPVSPSRFVTWIFRYEEDGERIKR